MNNLPINIDRDAFADALAPFGLAEGVSGFTVSQSGVEAILNDGTVAYIPWLRKPKYVDGVYQVVDENYYVMYYRCIDDVFYDEYDDDIDVTPFRTITRVGDIPDSGKLG